MTDVKIGCLFQLKDLESSIGNPVPWILCHSEKKQIFVATIIRIYGKFSHCIWVYGDKIFNVIGDSIVKLDTKNLDKAIGEKVFWCLMKNYCPHSWCFTKVCKSFLSYSRISEDHAPSRKSKERKCLSIKLIK